MTQPLIDPLAALRERAQSESWVSHVDKQRPYVGTTQHGIILLGDISGYTSLVTNTELVHSQGILQYLFDTIYAATGDTFLVNEIEGDAIFAYCLEPKDPAGLLLATFDQMKHYGHAFYHAKKDMLDRRAVDLKACPCNACANIYGLSFKFILHYGEFAVNLVGPFVKLVGQDIVLAHRLLKNQVPSNEYILLTQAALEHLPEDQRQQFTQGIETIDHFGDVPIGYRIFNWQVEDAKHH